MVQIKNEKQYKAACDRINELLKVVGNDTPADDKNMLELDLISDLVAGRPSSSACMRWD